MATTRRPNHETMRSVLTCARWDYISVLSRPTSLPAFVEKKALCWAFFVQAEEMQATQHGCLTELMGLPWPIPRGLDQSRAHKKGKNPKRAMNECRQAQAQRRSGKKETKCGIFTHLPHPPPPFLTMPQTSKQTKKQHEFDRGSVNIEVLWA